MGSTKARRCLGNSKLLGLGTHTGSTRLLLGGLPKAVSWITNVKSNRPACISRPLEILPPWTWGKAIVRLNAGAIPVCTAITLFLFESED